MSAVYQSFEELDVWKKSRELKNDIFELTKKFPSEEKYRLIDQVIRSTRSVNAQISEGHGRKTFPDRTRFCVQARGSLSETLNHLIDAFDCGYITQEQLLYYRSRVTEIEKMLNGYVSWLESKQKPSNP